MSKWRFDKAPRSNRSAAIPLSRMVDLTTCVAKPECKIHHVNGLHISSSQFDLVLAPHEASACNLFERILASVSTKPHENWWRRDPQKNQDIPDQKTLRSSPSPRPDNMVATREDRNPNTLHESQPLLGNKAKSTRPSVIFFPINPSTLSWLPESRERRRVLLLGELPQHRLHFETLEPSRCLQNQHLNFPGAVSAPVPSRLNCVASAKAFNSQGDRGPRTPSSQRAASEQTPPANARAPMTPMARSWRTAAQYRLWCCLLLRRSAPKRIFLTIQPDSQTHGIEWDPCQGA